MRDAMMVMVGMLFGGVVGAAMGYSAGVRSSQRFVRTMIETGVLGLGAEWPKPNSMTALSNKERIKRSRSKLVLP